MKILWLNDSVVMRPENREEKSALVTVFSSQLEAGEDQSEPAEESGTTPA